MLADQIIVIRHAEKPTRKPMRKGIREDGTADPESLTVRGWQHAGALAAAFSGQGAGVAGQSVSRPGVIFAAGVGKKRAMIDGKLIKVGSRSRRPLQTITPLAAALGLTPVTAHAKGEEVTLVADALRRTGVILVCWQHQKIPKIGNLIMGDAVTVPQSWPEDRYDLIWVFDRSGRAWSFRQFFHNRLGG